MQDISCLVFPIPAHAFFKQAVLQGEIGHHLLQGGGFHDEGPSPHRTSRRGRCRPPAGACRPPGTPSTSRNTSRRQCLPGGTAPRCSPRRAVLPAQCGSSLRPNTASASPGECRGQASRAYQRRKRISVSSSLLGGYDEPEILRSSSCHICLTGAEAGHCIGVIPRLPRFPNSTRLLDE